MTCELCKKESRDTETAVDNKPRNIEKIIGVISDTHGLLRLEAVEALRGVDLILHAGG